ncbi:MAG: tRNA 2-thiouridine(34) synthase MnmA [Planctomycetes bacterium]|nr:tRNA 2-thiouridine(34) synthase MnmA [Planctomycetota bacterium]
MSDERIVVGMSGGVDSSLTAVMMKEQGFEVVGVTMKLWPCVEEDGGFVREDACCSPTETIDARAVANHAGVAHYVIDMEDEFRESVVKNFLEGYERGETPNPCIRCNESVKFGDLWKYAKSIGASSVATGHYARIAQRGERYCLQTPADKKKDQTYFLFSLTQEQMASARFPLGDYTKDEVRSLSQEKNIVTANKAESMDICFVGEGGVEGFLRKEIPDAFTPGPIVHRNGQALGEHQGLSAFTIGQRKGLGVAYTEPLYVVQLDKEHNTVVLGSRDDLLVNDMIIRDCTWHLGDLPESGLRCLVRNRYRSLPVAAVIIPLADNAARVEYEEPQAQPSAGQACVAYDLEDDLCFGGGWFVRP